MNKKGIIELSRELMEVSKKAREGKLTASDMQGGCFTIQVLVVLVQLTLHQS